MQRVQEVGTIRTLDSRVDALLLSSNGEGGSRPPGDWLPPAEAMFEEAERSGRADGLLRVEYVGEAEDSLAVIGRAADAWLVRMDYDLDVAGPRIAAIELRPRSTATDARVGSRYLRRMGLGPLLADVDNLLLVDYMVSKLAGGRWRRRVHRPGRARQPDVFYAEWAAKYVAAVAADPVAPNTVLVAREKAEGRHVTKAQLKAYVIRARERGLLTEVPAGARSGGELTSAALSLLGG